MALTKQERQDCLEQLLHQYIEEEKRNKAQPFRTHSNAKSLLQGFCLAFEYSIEDDGESVTIRTKKDSAVMSMEKR